MTRVSEHGEINRSTIVADLMRHVRVFVIALLAAACSGSGLNRQLQIELLEMARADQDLRGRAMSIMQGLPETQADLMLFIEEQNELNITNFDRLKTIISTHGWPGRSLVGAEGTVAALTIFSHATIDQQKALLPMLRDAVKAGQMTASELARREDSILVNDGKSQIYGTFFVFDSDGNPVLAPLQDPANVEERRRSVGLPSMEAQFQQLERELGLPIGRGDLATDGD